MNLSIVSTDVIKYGKSEESGLDLLAVEEPLLIKLGYGPRNERKELDLIVTMRTPGHDLELTAGFLLSEGLIRKFSDVIHLDHCQRSEISSGENNVVRVELAEQLSLSEDLMGRNFNATASCGLCGATNLEQVMKKVEKLQDSLRVYSESITTYSHKLQEYQVSFNRTGGMHAAGVFNSKADLVLCREDIGRHNAVDKVIGASLFKGDHPLNNYVLFLSGRAGFELIQKAVVAGVQVVASVGAPSSLAVRLAKAVNLTLIGFVRGSDFNVYSGEQRIKNEDQDS